MLRCDLFVFLYNCRYVTMTNFHSVTCCTRLLAHDDCKLFPILYEGKLLNNRNFIVTFFTRVLIQIVSYFSTQSHCFATHLVHLSTSLRMPSRKKLFGMAFNQLCTASITSSSANRLTDVLSSVSKSFHPFIHSPLTQTTVSTLNLHFSVDFRSFHTP